MAIRVNERYWKLMERLGKAVQVDQRDIQAVLGECPLPASFSRAQGKTQFELRVEKRYPINWTTHGRIIDVAGPSNRNKTTGLIYAATLLGIDWDKASTFIDSRGILRTAAAIKKDIQEGQRTFLRLSNGKYELTVETANGQIVSRLRDLSTGSFLFDLDGTPITLRYEDDWAQFRAGVRQACDVQMVGKGRNFVVQVGLEEGQALAEYADDLFKRIGEVRQDLQHQAQDAPTVSEEELRRMVERENQAIVVFESDLNTARQTRAVYNTKVMDLQGLARLIGEIHAIQGSERYLNLSATLENVQAQERLATRLTTEVAELERDIAESEQSLQEGKDSLAIVQTACSQLVRETNRLAQRSTAIVDLLSSLEAAARLQNLNQIRALAEPVLRLADDSSNVFPTVVRRDHWSTLSEGTTLMPIQMGGGTCTTVGDLKRFFEGQVVRVAEALVLRPILDQFYSSVSAATERTSESLEELRANCSALESGLATRRENLRDRHAELETAQQAIGSATDPFGGPSGLAQQVQSARVNLPSQVLSKIEEAETKASQVDFPGLWGRRDVGQELQEEISRALQIVVRTTEEVNRKTSAIREAQRRIAEYQEILRNPSSLNRELSRRTAALAVWQPTMREIRNYFDARRLAFESQQVAEGAEWQRAYESAQAHLGSAFGLVMETLNQLIKERSPYCYVNRETPERLRVKSYDFLNERVMLEDGDQATDETVSGGGETSMTVRGLASRMSGTPLGNVLLVDEFGDAPTFKDMVYEDLLQLDELAMSIFVDVVNEPELRLAERG